MNIIHRKIKGKPVIIYEDHRTILNVLYHAFYENKLDFKNPPNLICFDKHDDGKEPSNEAMNKIRKYRKNLPDIRKFSDFVEWDLNGLDDDWLKVGIELGFINNVVLIGVKETSNFKYGKNIYTDHKDQEHKIWLIGHIWSELEHQGKLSDICRRNEFEGLWEILNWEPNNGRFTFKNNENRDVILDFDLDCFTTDINGFTMAWPQEFLYNSFLRYPNINYTSSWNTKKFIEQIYSSSKFITIARESECSGNMRETELILEIIDEVIMDKNMFKNG